MSDEATQAAEAEQAISQRFYADPVRTLLDLLFTQEKRQNERCAALQSQIDDLRQRLNSARGPTVFR